MTEDWRVQVTAEDYLRGQNKKVATEQRRPVIRKASDLVGPGINSSAVPITDYNDILATFNGYYSSSPGALYAPNAVDSFVGSVIMDELLGGVQRFTSMVSGIEYTRVFQRNPSDETSISFLEWTSVETTPATVESTVSGAGTRSITVLPSGTNVTLTMPQMTFRGDPLTYARATTSLSILRTGVYTGHMFLRTTENITVDTIQVEYPVLNAMTYDVLYLTTPGHGVHVPLHFVATDVHGFIKVHMQQAAAPNQHAEFMYLKLTRLGDV